jgi:hypothetical protein
MKKLLDDLFVPLDISIKLSEIGFNEPCMAHRIKENGILLDLFPGSLYYKQSPSSENVDPEYSINTPTFQQVSEWFLTKNIHVTYTPIFVNMAFGFTTIDSYVPHCNTDNYFVEYKTPREAYIAAINEAIDSIKSTNT